MASSDQRRIERAKQALAHIKLAVIAMEGADVPDTIKDGLRTSYTAIQQWGKA